MKSRLREIGSCQNNVSLDAAMRGRESEREGRAAISQSFPKGLEGPGKNDVGREACREGYLEVGLMENGLKSFFRPTSSLEDWKMV